jgi:hypothetical protein
MFMWSFRRNMPTWGVTDIARAKIRGQRFGRDLAFSLRFESLCNLRQAALANRRRNNWIGAADSLGDPKRRCGPTLVSWRGERLGSGYLL